MQQSRYFSRAEEVSAACREIYSRYGYRRYRMNRFEEYDLYAANRNFLVGDSIITFTGQGGRLMALKPDVTLSIVKRADCRPGGQEKVFYIENVYRADKSGEDFREIMQLGLECLGDIGLYQTAEVIALAAGSLAAISDDYILDLSHRGFIAGLLEESGLEAEAADDLLAYVGGRNPAGIAELCRRAGVNAGLCRRLIGLTSIYGPYPEAIGRLEAISSNDRTESALEEIRRIYSLLEAFGRGGRINLDFSHTGDMKYYNGVTFSGYVKGIPSALLSGGRYDGLLHSFGKSGGAVGFAIYLDLLDAIPELPGEYDIDLLLVAGEGVDDRSLAAAVKAQIALGRSVTAARGEIDPALRCREIMRLGILENTGKKEVSI